MGLSSRNATFEKPEKQLHLKALYLKGFIDAKPLTKMLVDGGAAINLMAYSTFRKLGRKEKDLCPTDIRLTNFSGNASVNKGVMCVELIVCSKSLSTISLWLMLKAHTVYFKEEIGSMPIVVFYLLCTKA